MKKKGVYFFRVCMPFILLMVFSFQSFSQVKTVTGTVRGANN